MNMKLLYYIEAIRIVFIVSGIAPLFIKIVYI